ncbi:MAG: hypothetical protein WAK16_07440 [Candidatus Cybelea sp.]
MLLGAFGRRAFSICAALVMFSGCGGSQTTPAGAVSQSATRTGANGKSWMLPGASSGDLIYATHGCGGTCVISYPALKSVGFIADSGAAVCSDAQGNIFLPKDYQVVEYAHGGTQPIATLALPGDLAAGCSVDSETNNLAVVYESSVAVFADEQGTPTSYNTHLESLYCGYDDSGNLLLTATMGSASGFRSYPMVAETFQNSR